MESARALNNRCVTPREEVRDNHSPAAQSNKYNDTASVMNRQTRRTGYGTWLGAYAIYVGISDAIRRRTTETKDEIIVWPR